MTRRSLALASALAALLLGIAPTVFAQQAPGQPSAPAVRPVPDALLDGPPEDFIPLRPRTGEDRERIEIITLYSAARALEDARLIRGAKTLFEEANRRAPDDPAILRRLSMLNLATGNVEKAVEFGERALELEPDDPPTLARLVAVHVERKNDPDAALALLEKVIAHPRHNPTSAGGLLARRLQGDLHDEVKGDPARAAEAYAALIAGLDDRRSNRLNELEARNILREGDAEAFLHFGEVFVRAKRYDLAVQALQRGLLYDPTQAQIGRVLAEALFRSGESEKALQMLEDYIKRQPQGREAYELLSEILASQNRSAEFLPRLEQAAAADSKNVSLQFALSEEYRRAGRAGDADRLLADLVNKLGDPQVYGPLSSALLQEKKTADLVKVLVDAARQQSSLQAVGPQIERIASDPAYAGEVLDEAIALFRSDPSKFNDRARSIVSYIANKAGKVDQLITFDELVLEHDPSPQNYRELFLDLFRHGRHQDAARAIEDLFAKHPSERNTQMLGALARCRMVMGQLEEALNTASEAQKLAPDDKETLLLVGYLLGRNGKNAEAIAHYQQILEKFPADEALEKQARAGLSSIYVNMDDYAKGEAELELLLAKDPDDPGINNDLGYLYVEQGKNLEKAEAMIRLALEEEPENSAYLDSLGWVLYKLDKLEEAAAALEKAAKDPNVDSTIHDHLGDAYYKLKRYDDALKAWLRAEAIAARSNPPDKRLEPIRRKIEELRALRATNQPDAPKPPSP
jgi:tetratricopeptide (TPR) repeat protein